MKQGQGQVDMISGWLSFSVLRIRQGAILIAFVLWIATNANPASADPVNTDSSTPDFISATESLLPCVVNIGTTNTTAGSSHESGHSSNCNDEASFPRRNEVVGSGAGTIISDDGLILTANHVIGNSPFIVIKLNDGTLFQGQREEMVLGTDPDIDIALLQLPIKDTPFDLTGRVAHLGDSNTVRVGQWSLAIGHPGGFDWTPTIGIVSCLGRRNLDFGDQMDIVDQNFIQHQAPISPGSSGGPLADIQGNIIGVNVGVNRKNNFISFALPINQVKPVIDSLRQYGRVVYPTIGILGITTLLPGGGRGLQILSVNSGSAAEESGLQAGDILLNLADSPVRSPQDLWRIERGLIPENEIGVEIEREKQRIGCHIVPKLCLPAKTESGVETEKNLAKAPLLLRGYAFVEKDGKVFVLSKTERGAPVDIAPGSIVEQVGLKDIGGMNGFLERLSVLDGWSQPCLLTVRPSEGDPVKYVRL